MATQGKRLASVLLARNMSEFSVSMIPNMSSIGNQGADHAPMEE